MQITIEELLGVGKTLLHRVVSLWHDGSCFMLFTDADLLSSCCLNITALPFSLCTCCQMFLHYNWFPKVKCETCDPAYITSPYTVCIELHGTGSDCDVGDVGSVSARSARFIVSLIEVTFVYSMTAPTIAGRLTPVHSWRWVCVSQCCLSGCRVVWCVAWDRSRWHAVSHHRSLRLVLCEYTKFQIEIE